MNLGYYTSVLTPDVVRVQVFLAVCVLALTVYMVAFWRMSRRSPREGSTQPAYVHHWVSSSTFTSLKPALLLPEGYADDIAVQPTIVLGKPVRSATTDAGAADLYRMLDSLPEQAQRGLLDREPLPVSGLTPMNHDEATIHVWPDMVYRPL